MSLVLDLPSELETELSSEAERLGLALPEYVVRLLATGRTGHCPAYRRRLIAYWQNEGLIGTRPDIVDSQEHARKLREQVEQRRRSSRWTCSTLTC